MAAGAVRRRSPDASSRAAVGASISPDASSSSPAASRGLGLVIARQLAAEGARLCLLARERRRNSARGGTVSARHRRDDGPLRHPPPRRRARRRRRHRRSLGRDRRSDQQRRRDSGRSARAHDARGDFENAMATHFWGPLHLMFEIVPSMRRRGFGRIVNISSIGGRVAVPHLAPYCASKFALAGSVRRGAHRTRSVRHPGDDRCARSDAHGIARQRQRQGQSRSRVRLVRDLGFTARADRVGRDAARQIIDACRYGDPELTITVAGQARDHRQSPRARRRRERDDGGE